MHSMLEGSTRHRQVKIGRGDRNRAGGPMGKVPGLL